MHCVMHTCYDQSTPHIHALIQDVGSMNAAYEFSGDRSDVEVGMSYVEKKVLEREETRIDLEQATKAETTLLSAG